MTTPDRNSQDDTLRKVREILEKAKPEQVRRLLWDIRTSRLINKDMADTLH